MRRMILSVVSCALVMAGALQAASAQQYPNRLVRIIVGYSPGSATDIYARVTAQLLAQRLGQSVIVENRPGAGALIAIDGVRREHPDGYTLLWADSSLTILPTIRHVQYNPLKDFMPLAMMIDMPSHYVANAKVPAQNISEFIALAKKKPGTLRWGSPGVGSGAYMSGQLLGLKTGIDITHVPYKGGGEVLGALLAHEVDLGIQSYGSVRSAVAAGQLRILATTSEERVPEVGAPTMIESGYPGFVTSSWWGVAAPAGLPEEIADRLEKELLAVAHSPEFHKSLVAYGFTGEPVGRVAFAKRMASDLATNTSIVDQLKAAGRFELSTAGSP